MESRITALEQTTARHETLIEMLRTQLDGIHAAVIRIETQLASRPSPGVSEFCKSHLEKLNHALSRIDDLEQDFAELQLTIGRWAGGLAVLAFVIGALLTTLKLFVK